jgi:hypothetical protein
MVEEGVGLGLKRALAGSLSQPSHPGDKQISLIAPVAEG